MLQSKIKFLIVFTFLLICDETYTASTNLRAKDSTNNGKTVIDYPECNDLKKQCSGLTDNDDILIIECLQGIDSNVLAKLNDKCQNVVWNHMRQLISNENVNKILWPLCKYDISNFNCQLDNTYGSYLKCIVSRKEEIQNADCIKMTMRLENVAFYDYKWISGFLTHCGSSIEKFKCGRIDHDRLSQSETVVCLQNNVNELDKMCQKELLKLSEIQGDNIKLDKQLFISCADDHLRFCKQYPSGSGRVFKCLLQHYENNELTKSCQNQLFRRLKLMSQDYKVNRGLMKACREDIKKSHCRRQTSDDKSIRMAQVLLCLENMLKNGTKIDQDCVLELLDHRKLLMEDYHLTPEVVTHCNSDITKLCRNTALSGSSLGSTTLHCLMDHVRLKNARSSRISELCLRSLEALMKIADVGEDWRVDPILHEACDPVVKVACANVNGGNARVISCLMDNIGADHMTEDCEDALMQIQYFVARDFRLDPQLYRACKEDAMNYCHANNEWDKSIGYDPDNSPLVLPCLYRYAYNEDEMRLKPQCFDQIKRVMRQRAISVDLMPEIENNCLEDLMLYCFDKPGKGEEMLCLQNNLEKLEDKCKDVVSKYTEVEARNTELNPHVMNHCKNIIAILCGDEQKHDDGNLMECLVTRKNDPLVKANMKCRASIEHFQLITLKDYKFTFKFKAACKPYAIRFCPKAETRAAIIACLSERILNDTVSGFKSDVHKDCRQQLKAQLFLQRENINFDPKLAKSCKMDIEKFCASVEPGSAQVLECLQATPDKYLTETCQIELFKIKKQEITDNTLDYALMTACAEPIKIFCDKAEPSHVLDCLRRHKDDRRFNKKCLLIVQHRIVEQNSDFRLNPSLQENCRQDIKKFCSKVISHDVIVKCLKNEFKRERLTHRCEKEMAEILKEQALDVQLNPLLRAVCANELETICRQDAPRNETEGGEFQEECLKNALLNKKIQSPGCQEEVANMIQESSVDIHVDPLLQQTCSIDLLKYCNSIEQGNGRLIKCLKLVMEDKTKQLTTECKRMFTKRLEMFKRVEEHAPPESLEDVYHQVVMSPSKHYFFFVLITLIGCIFVIGLYCGRVTRRQIIQSKKK